MTWQKYRLLLGGIAWTYAIPLFLKTVQAESHDDDGKSAIC
jgi:hypothetical protein